MMLHRLQIMRSLATVLTIGIFVFDLLTPAAAAVGILYLLPMMIYLWNPPYCTSNESRPRPVLKSPTSG